MSPDPAPESSAPERDDSSHWKAVLHSSYANVKVDRVNVAAGAFAYRWFLSFFPTVIALLGISTLVTVPPGVVVNLIHGATKALPSAAAQVFTGAIANATHRSGADLWTTVVAIVVALWSATSGMVIVEEGLDMAYGIAADRSFLVKRVVALPLLLGGAVLGGSASALIIFGPQLGSLIKRSAPVGGAAFAASWTVLRWVIALSLMNLLFTLLYYLAPNRSRPRWRWTSSGAVFATIVWAVVSLGFSFYTSNFGSFGATYGAFAGVAVFIFWLYLTGLAILVGGELDAAVERLACHASP